MSAAPSCGDAGFTLLEALVALAIVALAWLLVVPALPDGLFRSELERSARALTTELREARARALAERREVVVRLDRPGATVRSVEPGAVRFFPEGGATAAAITLERGGRTYRIEVDWLTGRVALAG
jgi:general secretion pathway protein H